MEMQIWIKKKPLWAQRYEHMKCVVFKSICLPINITMYTENVRKHKTPVIVVIIT